MYANRRNSRVFQEIGVEEHDGDVIFRPKVEIWPFRTCAVKIRNITLINGGIAKIIASYRK